MALKLANLAISSLAASITSSATTMLIQAGDAGKFPVLGAGDWHPATIVDPVGNMEIVRVTARDVATLTVVRAQEGTTARTFAAGSRVDVRLTAGTLGTMAEQSSDDVNISGGKIKGIEPLGIEEGGTGGGDPASARSNLELGNVNNTADEDKPISEAQQLALDDKFDKSGGKIKGDVTVEGEVDLTGHRLKNVGRGVADYLKGLITSKSSAFVVSVGAGEIKGNSKLVVNTGPFTKNLNEAWVAGSGNGGRLEAAALVANSTYHLHALSKDSDGSFDWGYSSSATAPTLPSGYSWVGRFDWCYVNSGVTAIVDYTQVGNTKYLAGTSWFNSITSLLADALYAPPAASPIPSGIKTDVNVSFSGTAGVSGVFTVYANDGDSLTAAGGPAYMTARNDAWATTSVKLRTNLARQLRLNITFGGSGSNVTCGTNAVEDYTLNRIY